MTTDEDIALLFRPRQTELIHKVFLRGASQFFEGSLVRKFEQVNLRTTGTSQLFEKHKKYNAQLFEGSLVRRFTCSKIRTTEPSNNWTSHLFEGSLVRRFTCSNFRTTETSNNWDVPVIRSFTCSKSEKCKMRSCSKAQLFEI